jgi:hypothetical protein
MSGYQEQISLFNARSAKRISGRNDMKEIPLTQGKVALVDDEDYPLMSLHKWHVSKGNGHTFYARSEARKNGIRRRFSMHREIMGISKDHSKIIDHINHNTLDNRKVNLRIATYSENQANRNGIQKNNTSGFLGVKFDKRTGHWYGEVRFNKQKFQTVRSRNKSEVIIARDALAAKIHGTFATLTHKPNTTTPKGE